MFAGRCRDVFFVTVSPVRMPEFLSRRYIDGLFKTLRSLNGCTIWRLRFERTSNNRKGGKTFAKERLCLEMHWVRSGAQVGAYDVLIGW